MTATSANPPPPPPPPRGGGGGHAHTRARGPPGAPEQAAHVLEHVDACTSCRAVLAGLARSDTRTVAPPPPETAATRLARVETTPAGGAPAAALPARLLREYLVRDAPQRERVIAFFWGSLALVTVALFVLVPPRGGERFALAAAVIQGVFFAHEAAVYVALRRGWYSPRLPLLVTLMEVTIFFAMQLASTIVLPPD